MSNTNQMLQLNGARLTLRGAEEPARSAMRSYTHATDVVVTEVERAMATSVPIAGA